MVTKNLNGPLLKFAILCIALCAVASGAVAPAIPMFIDKFGAEYTTLVQLIITLPQFCLIILAPIFAKILDFFKRRTLLIAAFIFFIVGGFGPFLLANVEGDALAILIPILIFRVIIGAGAAIITPIGAILIDDFYEGQTKNTLMGFNIVFTMAGATIFQMLGGYLASLNWSYVFFIYLFGIIVLAVVAFVIPEPEKKQQEGAAEVNAAKAKMPAAVWWICAGNVVFEVVYFTVITNTAIEVVGEGFGDTTMAGMVMSVMTIASIVAGLVFGLLYKGVGRQTLTIGILAVAIGFAFNFFATNIGIMLVGVVLAGIGCGWVMSAMNNVVTEIAPKAKVPMALAFITATMGLGQFIQPIVFNPILSAFGLAVGKQAFLLGAILGLVLTCIFFVALLFGGKKKTEVEA